VKIIKSSQVKLFISRKIFCWYIKADSEPFAEAWLCVQTSSATRRLDNPIDFSKTPLLLHTKEAAANAPGLPKNDSSSRKNLFQFVNECLRTALEPDNRVFYFGEDVAYGRVFHYIMNLQAKFRPDRVFNMPINEQGIAGAVTRAAVEGMKPIINV
jgi:hypothetical protein